MLSLLDAQRAFAAALRGASRAPRAMSVYRANVFGNREAALAGAYPVVRRIVGAEFFAGMARAYASAHPSVSGDLNEYGEQLHAFVAAWPPASDLPYLPDVARMEWRVHRAHFAADAAAFDFSRPTEVRLAPGCALLESPWPLGAIWAAHQEGGQPAAVNLGAGGQRILVHRAGWRVEVCPLGAGDHAFLAQLGEGAALGAALEAAAAADAAFLPGVAFAAWVQAGVITQ